MRINLSRVISKLFSLSHLKLFILYAAAFIWGSTAGILTKHFSSKVSVTSAPASSSWGLSFQEEGKAPTGNAGSDELKKYNAY